MTDFDVSPLADALMQLDEGLRQFTIHSDNDLLRDGVIHRFEYCHELSLKFMRRALKVLFDEQTDLMTHDGVLRTAVKCGLIGDIGRWFEYRVGRNKIPRTYDSVTAIDVFACIQPFLADARELLYRLHDFKESTLS